MSEEHDQPKGGEPWPCGVLQGGKTPGLLLGLAGIGHFYLRLHDPAGVPPGLNHPAGGKQ